MSGLTANLLSILGIILALPSIIALFCSPYRATAILGLILGLAIIAFVIIFKWYSSRPPWSIIEYHKILKIKTRSGRTAQITMINKIRANHGGLTEFIHRNIRSDGQIKNFRFGSNPVPVSDITTEAQEFIVHERFAREAHRGEILSSHLTFDLIDSYKEAHNFTGHVPDFFTTKAKIEIHFPKSRPPRNAKAYRGIGAERCELGVPIISTDGNVAIWEGAKLKPGQRYRVEWDW